MGIVKAFAGAIGGTFADQWKDIITAGTVDEFTAVVPGVVQGQNNGRGSNTSASTAVLSNGSKILVPVNMAAFIFSQGGIEDIITEEGGYEYRDGQESVFDNDQEGVFKKDSFGSAIIDQVKDRVGYGGQTADQKRVAFVNLREIRGLKFGTKGPLVYNDLYYGTDLEIVAFGTFSLQIIDTEKFVRNFLPANVSFYTFEDKESRQQLLPEFLQSFTVALNILSKTYRISELPAHANEISDDISNDANNAGTWIDRFGIDVVRVGIENIEFSEDSRELVKQFSANKMNVKAYDDVSQRTSNIAAQQKIAQGVEDHGLGDGGGMVFGMNMGQNMAQNMGAQAEVKNQMSFDESVEAVKKLKELLDAGILSQEEFDSKKKELMGL
jgi:membrane protease subunit (stomatin/prohibitin family)